MNDELDVIRSLHREPAGPTAAVVRNEREHLMRFIAAEPDRNNRRAESDGSGGVVEIELATVEGISRGRQTGLLAAAASLMLVAGVGAITWAGARDTVPDNTTAANAPTDENSPVDSRQDTDGASDASPGTAAPISQEPPLLCGNAFPVTVDVPDLDESEDGPLPGREPTIEGQLIKHWPDHSIELRWPADTQPLYGHLDTHPVSDDSGLVFEIETEDGLAQMGFGVSETLVSGPVEPDLRISSAATESYGEECALMQFHGAQSDGLGFDVAFPVNDPIGQTGIVDINPVIIDQISADHAPTEVLSCEGFGVEPGVPATVESVVTNSPAGATPAEALAAFLDSPHGEGHARSSYAEIATPDGAFTYAKSDSQLDAYTALITVTARGTDEWAVTHLAVSGC